LVVLAVCLWTIATWTLANTGRLDRYGTPKAVDFAQFYVYGNLVATGNGTAMFDRAAWSSRLEEAWGGPGPTYVPLYPPTIGLVFAPFGYLSFAQAATAWTAASLILVAGGILLLVRAYPHVASDPFTVALLVAGWPALQQLLLVGQASALWFVCVVAAWQALRIGRPVLAGVALGLLGLKPSFLPFAIVVIAATGQWRALGGMLLSLTGQFAIVRVVFGPGLWTSYAGLVAEVIANPQRYEPTLWQAHGLLNALVLLLGRGWLSLGVYVVVSAGIAVWTIRGWRASPSPGVDTLSWSLFVLGLLITSAHLYVYDLVIMAAALLPILEWCLARPGARNVAAVARLAGASYVLPLFGPLVASVTHVQLSVVAFLGLFVVLARVCEARTLEPLNL
jgi:hypothetical protein